MENILFKQSFRGFDRNQVLEYIDDLSEQMAKQAENYTEIQKGLEDEIRTLTDKLSLTGENLSVSKENTLMDLILKKGLSVPTIREIIVL